MDLMKPLKYYILVRVEGIGDFKIEVNFCTLPDACFYCRKHGHLIQNYALLKQQEHEEQLQMDEEHRTFHKVKCKKRSMSPKH